MSSDKLVARSKRYARHNKFITFLFIAVAVLSVLLVGLLVYIFVIKQNVLDDVIIVRDGVNEVELVVDDLELVPGTVKKYDIVMKAKDSGNYALSIIYNETLDGGMKPFVDVQILYGEEEIYNGSLSYLISGKEVLKEMSFDRGRMYKVTFIYSMSESVGNEAQRTTTSFDINVAIMKED